MTLKIFCVTHYGGKLTFFSHFIRIQNYVQDDV